MVAPATSLPPQRAKSQTSVSSSALALTGLLAFAVIAGGGGVRYGLANLAVQIFALIVLGLHRDAFFAFWRRAPRTIRLVVSSSMLLPILHLIPLPATILAELPGRELVLQSRALAGAGTWFPLSVDPARTLVALFGLIPPLTVLVATYKLSTKHLISIAWVIVGLGLASIVLGAVQVASAGQQGLIYPENPMPGVLFGTFANRNSAGLFLVCCLSFASLLPSPVKIPAIPTIRAAICALLVIAIILTRSRSAIALTALPIAMVIAKLLWVASASWRHTSIKAGKGRYGGIILGAAGVVMAVGMLTYEPGRISDSLERFEAQGDARSYIWEDANYTARRYWPLGSGMGTFDEVFQVDESLENLTSRRVGRAHNDYIEVAIEAGLPGFALVAAWFAVIAWLTWRARLPSQRWVAWSASGILLAIALQSVLDYPLRSQSMLAIAAFALATLMRVGASQLRSEA